MVQQIFMNMIRFLTVLLLILITSCTKEPAPVPVFNTCTREQWLSREAKELAASLTQRQRASQILMTGIDGMETFPVHLWAHFDGIVPGAILIFGYNIADTPEQVHAYITSCTIAFESMGGPVKPFFGIDHEGGTVFRLSGITAPLPSAKKTAEILTPRQAETLYDCTGVQLRLLGFTMNLAPVAEVLNSSNEPFLARRSFGSDPDNVIAYAAAAVRGYRRAGVLPVLKHYPGNSEADPHTGTSILAVSREQFDSEYRYPFRALFGAGAPAVLLSHILVPHLDPEFPFCLSPAGVTGILRNGDTFSGLVITDDISMGALAAGGRSSAENALRAIRAGCDMVMTSDTDIQAVVSAIEREAHNDPSFDERLEDAVMTILRAKLETGVIATARQRYALSRQGRVLSMNREPFDVQRFTEARIRATEIVEKSYGHD